MVDFIYKDEGFKLSDLLSPTEQDLLRELCDSVDLDDEADAPLHRQFEDGLAFDDDADQEAPNDRDRIGISEEVEVERTRSSTVTTENGTVVVEIKSDVPVQ